MKYFFCFILLLMASASQAQTSFVQQCLGTWQGTMFIYYQGQLKDSVAIKFTAAPTTNKGIFTWRTEYLSPSRPMVKDYQLQVTDSSKGVYTINEGDGITLQNHVVANKMYSLFETQDIYLTATYELVGTALMFEVTSAKKIPGSVESVTSYATTSVQKVILKRL